MYNRYLSIDLGFTEHYDGTALTNDSFASKYPGDDQGKYDWIIYFKYYITTDNFASEQIAILDEWKTNLQNELDNANLGYTQFPDGSSLTYSYDQIKQEINNANNQEDINNVKNKINTFKNDQKIFNKILKINIKIKQI